LRRLFDDPNIHDHVVSKILVSGDEGVSLFVFEGDAFGTARASVQTVEVLDCCYNRVGRIMGEYLHSHREARPILG
jgi:hypothetical protein